MLKRLLLIFAFFIGGFSAVAFFYWQQATQLPSWYSQASPEIPTNTTSIPLAKQNQIQPTRQQVLNKVAKNLNTNTKNEVQLDAEEVHTLIFSEITQKPSHSQLAQAVKATNTQIQDGRISTGAVIDFNAISQDELSPQEKATLTQFLSKIPAPLKEQPIYIGIEGKPTISQQQVSFDDAALIRVGNLSFSLADVSQHLGIPPEQINQKLSQQLKKLPIKVKTLEIVGDRLVVNGLQTAQ